MKCSIHKVEMVCFCPVCRGEVRSKRKAAAARINGRLGGRPRKNKQQKKAGSR